MIDRSSVALILGDDTIAPQDGQARLEALEAQGYRVVPEGMVPQFDDLDHVAQLLKVLGDIGGRIHNPQKCREASNQIRWLRDLAILVLRLDADAVDVVTRRADAEGSGG